MNYYYGAYENRTRYVGAVSVPQQLENQVRTSMPVLHRANRNPPSPGTGLYFPQAFVPPRHSPPPEVIFPATTIRGGQTRFVNRYNRAQFLIYTDGACLDNGTPIATAAWAFVYGPRIASDPFQRCSIVGEPLEDEGPYGELYPHTSNRAELRAVIAALNYRRWSNEGTTSQPGFNSLVIATDSTYVARGATEWARGWIRNGWRRSNGDDVANRDLWECLLGHIEDLANEQEIDVEFWRIPREWNTIADAAAKIAADKKPRSDGRFVNWVCDE